MSEVGTKFRYVVDGKPCDEEYESITHDDAIAYANQNTDDGVVVVQKLYGPGRWFHEFRIGAVHLNEDSQHLLRGFHIYAGDTISGPDGQGYVYLKSPRGYDVVWGVGVVKPFGGAPDPASSEPPKWFMKIWGFKS